jgi:class 3 adenylate cyclase
VNVAARLEQLTKATQAPVLVSASTRVRLPPDIALVAAGTVEVRGRVETLAIFIPRALAPSPESVRSAQV